MSRGRRKPGPKPTLRSPEMMRFALPAADRRALDAYAKRHGISRSVALRQAVTLLVSQQPDANDTIARDA